MSETKPDIPFRWIVREEVVGTEWREWYDKDFDCMDGNNVPIKEEVKVLQWFNGEEWVDVPTVE